MGKYDSIGLPISGQPISSGNFGIKVRDAIIDLDLRVAAIATSRVDKIKAANETRINTTTLTIDAELQGIFLDEGQWEITAIIAAIGGAGGIAVKSQWAFTGTWTVPSRWVTGPTAANTAVPSGAMSLQTATYPATSDYIAGLSTSIGFTHWREYSKQVVVTAAGNMSYNWAPNVSSATSGGIRAGSSITAIQIA